MKKINFNKMLILSLIIIVLFNTLNLLFSHWFFTSIGFCVCGLLWVIHPIPPKKIETLKNIKLAIRIAGIVLILIGLITRLHF